MKRINYVLLFFIILIFSSCAIQPIHRDDVTVKKKPKIVKKRKGYGPPPHAPAHGYRHKHEQGVEMRYDSGLGVYVVIKIPGMYFDDGLYIRWSDAGYWEVGYHYKGPWRMAVGNEIPDTLDRKKGKGPKNKGRGKGNYKYKGKKKN